MYERKDRIGAIYVGRDSDVGTIPIFLDVTNIRVKHGKQSSVGYAYFIRCSAATYPNG